MLLSASVAQWQHRTTFAPYLVEIIHFSKLKYVAVLVRTWWVLLSKKSEAISFLGNPKRAGFELACCHFDSL